MPTYEYRCKDCSHTFDAYQSFTDDALTECPSCGGTVKKVFGNVGIAFKGSGFYKTDSRGGTKSSTGSDSSSGNGSSDSTKSDTTSSGGTGSSSGSSASGSSGSGSSDTSSSSTPAASKS